ncbi:SRPBCC family protein [Parafrankia sp. CH37]|uniref:SRPBCC family protein n=1 Tax=Parafrankia sp. CH37 TaxID=683308 RepID=UPI000B8159E3|nr:SRPBCC family protein [Parafrankia sp. CH37]
MATIQHEVAVALPPREVWDVLRDVGAVHRRLLPGRVLDVHLDGDVRTLTMPDGHLVRELIVTVDDRARRLVYAVIEGARPPLCHHQASFQVLPDGDGHSRLRWTTDLLPESLASLIEARTGHGIREMKEVLEQSAATALDR